MKNICICFQVHQPFRLGYFPFFEIGQSKDYFDDLANWSVLKRVATDCYLPVNKLLLKLMEKYGDRFKVSFSISGTVLDQFERYMPEVLDSFRKLAKTGNVEFLSSTNGHSLAMLKSKREFMHQVKAHSARIQELFGQKPVSFWNVDQNHSNFLANIIHEMGYQVLLTEDSKQVLESKNPVQELAWPDGTGLQLLLKNISLSDDIAFRYPDKNWNEWPLNAPKFINWMNAISDDNPMINLFLDFETFGEHQKAKTGILKFLKNLISEALKSNFGFVTPSQLISFPSAGHQPCSLVTYNKNEDYRKLSFWLENHLQRDAFDTLYELEENVFACRDSKLHQTWLYLQASDHFYYMRTDLHFDEMGSNYLNPYRTPYDAYINFMNVLSDFSLRLDQAAISNQIQPVPSIEHLDPIMMNDKTILDTA